MASKPSKERPVKMATQDFGEFTLETTRKPVAAVRNVEIPAPLAAALEEKYKESLDSADFELVLTAQDMATAKKLSLYAKAWGAKHDPRLYVRRLPNTKGHTDNQARLVIATWDSVPPESRPGRRKQARS